MLLRRRVIAAFLVLSLLPFFMVQAAPAQASQAQQHVPYNYIVVLNDGTSDPGAAAKSMADEHGLFIMHVYKHALKGFSAVIPPAGLENVKSDPKVRFVEQDQVVQAFALEPQGHKPGHQPGGDKGGGKGGKGGGSTQPAEVLPTGINRIDAENAVLVGNVDIAVIDTGIDLKHPDLNVVRGATCQGAGRPGGNDDNGHGTHVAGIAAAKDNEIGVVGVAAGANLWSVKVLDKFGSGTLSCVIAGIDYVTGNAAEIDVANMSLGCACSTLAGDLALQNSVAAGVTYAVAAGNSARNVSSFWPASNPNVITVSAIADSDGACGGQGGSTSYGADDTFATFSNFGAGVDLAAPGVDIFSTYKGQTYKTLSGTSMASPHVAGAASLYKAGNPGASPSDVLAALVAAGIPQGQGCLGEGNGGFSGDTDGYPEPLVYAG